MTDERGEDREQGQELAVVGKTHGHVHGSRPWNFKLGNEWVWSMGTPLPRSYDGMHVLRSRLIPQLKALSNEAQL